MPYSAGVYTVPPGTLATTLTPVDSSDYNAFVDDIETAQNAARPVTAGGTGGTSVITGWDGLAKKGTDIATASSINLTTATGPSLTLTGTTTVTAVTLAEGSFRLVRAAGAFQITASASLLCNGSSSVNMSVVAEELLVFRGGAGGVVSVGKIGGGVAAATNAQALGATSAAVGVVPANLAQERTLDMIQKNLSIAASVSSSALTVSIKGIDGNDPSATNPVTINFRSVTATDGKPVSLTLTAALSLVISSGSTMGFASAQAGRLWIGIFNDGGTARIGLVNALSGTSIMYLRDGIYSATSEGGAGAADSAQVIYSNAAVTSKAFTIIGYLEATEATAGTWATAPSLLKIWQPGDPLPGDTIQSPGNYTSASATGTTTIPFDDTIPQNTEGTQYMTQAITPTSAANKLRIEHHGMYANSVALEMTVALFQDSTADALCARVTPSTSINVSYTIPLLYEMKAGTTSSTTFKIRAGANSASTMTFNGFSGGRAFGGVANSLLTVTEIMA